MCGNSTDWSLQSHNQEDKTQTKCVSFQDSFVVSVDDSAADINLLTGKISSYNKNSQIFSHVSKTRFLLIYRLPISINYEM